MILKEINDSLRQSFNELKFSIIMQNKFFQASQSTCQSQAPRRFANSCFPSQKKFASLQVLRFRILWRKKTWVNGLMRKCVNVSSIDLFDTDEQFILRNCFLEISMNHVFQHFCNDTLDYFEQKSF